MICTVILAWQCVLLSPGHSEVVKRLLAAEASKHSVVNKEGKSPLYVCKFLSSETNYSKNITFPNISGLYHVCVSVHELHIVDSNSEISDHWMPQRELNLLIRAHLTVKPLMYLFNLNNKWQNEPRTCPLKRGVPLLESPWGYGYYLLSDIVWLCKVSSISAIYYRVIMFG